MDLKRKCQIYLLTPPQIADANAFAKTLTETLSAAPVAYLQIRLKNTPKEKIIDTAKTLIPAAHRHGTLVLINDDPEIALKTGADGVHLGQQDMDIKSAQEMLLRHAIFGITCHNSKELALSAGSNGADYIAFGSFFKSATKPEATPADPGLLTWWHEKVGIPSVAIGGITVKTAKTVINAGADYIAVSGGVWEYAHGPATAVRRLSELCVRYSPSPAS